MAAGDKSQAAADLSRSWGGRGRGGGLTVSGGNPGLGSLSHGTPQEAPRHCPSALHSEPSPNEDFGTQFLARHTKSFCFLLGKHKDDLSNVNLLCTFKTTFSALGSENIFARTSKIH